MRRDRWLDWDGCVNVRDLGGLPTADGSRTSWRRLVRSETVQHLTPAGWAALEAYGVRTVVDLRNDDEIGEDTAGRPDSVTTLRVPLDDVGDTEMWEFFESEGYGGLGPLYYPEFMRRKPERCAAAVSAIAAAGTGGVLFCCAGGRDRTGLVAMLMLALAGVPTDAIVADHALTDDRLCAFNAAHGRSFTPSDFDYLYEERGTSPERVISGLVDGSTLGTDLPAYLRSGGLTDDEIAAVRLRLRDGGD